MGIRHGVCDVLFIGLVTMDAVCWLSDEKNIFAMELCNYVVHIYVRQKFLKSENI